MWAADQPPPVTPHRPGDPGHAGGVLRKMNVEIGAFHHEDAGAAQLGRARQQAPDAHRVQRVDGHAHRKIGVSSRVQERARRHGSREVAIREAFLAQIAATGEKRGRFGMSGHGPTVPGCRRRPARARPPCGSTRQLPSRGGEVAAVTSGEQHRRNDGKMAVGARIVATPCGSPVLFTGGAQRARVSSRPGRGTIPARGAASGDATQAREQDRRNSRIPDCRRLSAGVARGSPVLFTDGRGTGHQRARKTALACTPSRAAERVRRGRG